jgi:hypothetical protein
MRKSSDSRRPGRRAWPPSEWHNLMFCFESCVDPFLFCPPICQIQALRAFWPLCGEHGEHGEHWTLMAAAHGATLDQAGCVRTSASASHNPYSASGSRSGKPIKKVDQRSIRKRAHAQHNRLFQEYKSASGRLNTHERADRSDTLPILRQPRLNLLAKAQQANASHRPVRQRDWQRFEEHHAIGARRSSPSNWCNDYAMAAANHTLIQINDVSHLARF